MNEPRQAHGLLLINNYVYSCAGLDQGFIVLSSCERFNLENINTQDEGWQKDVPDMIEAKFSMTMLVIDKTWIYSFGGATGGLVESDVKGLEVERLNTKDVDDPKKDAKWERFYFKSDHIRCC